MLPQLQRPVHNHPVSFRGVRTCFHVPRGQTQYIITIKLNKIIFEQRTVIRKINFLRFLKE